MDVPNIFQVSMLSHFLNNPTTFFPEYYLHIFIVLYALYKLCPYYIFDMINDNIKEFIENNTNVSSIVIPYHLKIYSSPYSNTKAVKKTLYSDKFLAINHYIKKKHMHKISSLLEIINFENTRCSYENVSDYILIPKDKQKIYIDDKFGIFIEIIFDSFLEENENKDEKNISKSLTKKYIYKVSRIGKNSVQIINDFITRIEEEYKNDTSTSIQTVYEYKKTYNDDDDKTSIVFNESPFYTNKSFDNIFFENKCQLIEYLKPFIKSDIKDNDIYLKYEKFGVPFKGTFMLHGPPGCGKSSLIKAVVKYTKRHCLIVSWSKLKTCNDFTSLFRPIKINNKILTQEELVIVFEDFDANNSEILKIRDNLKTDKNDVSNVKNIISNENKEEIKKICEESFMTNVLKSKNDDDLSLEYILNVLDGVIELHNSLVFFTTNDLDAIDPALKRTGRIDKIIKMDYINKPLLEEILSYYFNNKCIKKYNKKINDMVNSNICYADIIQSIMDSKNIDDFFSFFNF